MKKSIRKELLEKRKALSEKEVNLKSKKIIARLLELPQILKAERIHVYYPINNEVDIRPFIEWLWEKGKKVIMPRANFETHELDNYYIITFGQLEETHLGLHEPYTTSPLHLGSPDVIIVPGVAFGEDRNRLGYGGGFYDRFLNESISLRIGVAFEMQIVKQIPAEKHDQRMDLIITEERIIS
ncbi:MAG: 5-formyltetrahydrofolate cyclo-ligase [Candidatus Cloacimonetes bacterium]|nr:5-formyltetrahydrofolate cyclo-ligase [Candidatus Cloacimonadota bacterium]